MCSRPECFDMTSSLEEKVMIMKLKRTTLRYAGEMLVLGAFVAILSYRAIPERYNNPFEFCLLWLVCLVMGICTTPRSKHRISSALGIFIIPLAIDNFLTCFDEIFFHCAAALCTLALAFYTAAVVLACYGDIRAGRYHRKWARFLQHYLYRSRRIISWILAAVVAAGSVCGLVEEKREEETKVFFSVSRAEHVLETMGNNIDMIRKLDQECWESLSYREKYDTLQQVADTECLYLGLPQVTVSLVEMERPSVMGYYDHSDRTVNVNHNAFQEASAEYLLSVVFHEIFHCMEYGLVEVYFSVDPVYRELQIFDKAEIYLEELTDYTDGFEDPGKYYAQLVEQDSREYAEKRVQQYREAIAYIKNTTQQEIP